MVTKIKEGVVFTVKVISKSRKTSVVGWEGERLKIRLHATPEKEKANQELLIFLSKILDLPSSLLQILSGKHSPIKRILVINFSEEKVKKALERALSTTEKGKLLTLDEA